MKLKIRTTLTLLACMLATVSLADRTSTAVTGHRFVSNVTEAQVDDIVADGFRMHDIEIVSNNPMRYAASFVRNSGSYKKDWWWTANKTHAELAQFISDRNARMIDMEITIVNGQKRYAGTFIKNAGDDFVNWKAVEDQTWAQLQQAVTSYGGRVVDLDVRSSNGSNLFSAVIIKNVGDFAKPFTCFSGKSMAEVQELAKQTGFQLTDLERVTSNTFAGVLESNPGAPWWWKLGQSWSQLEFDAGQFNARVANLERFTVNGEARFNYILINNCNALETRVGEMMRQGSDGVMGFYVRQVGGARLGQMMADYRFYPASSIKMLQHMYWSWRVQNGTPQNLQVRIWTNHTNDVHAQNEQFVNQSLILTQQNMMYNSSNSNANALQDAAGGNNGFNGRATIMNFAQSVVGLDEDIQLNHKFADGGMSNDPYNVATGREYGLMMEKATNGSIFTANGFAYLRANMLNETFNSGFASGLRAVLNQEGALAGKTQAQINNYWSLVRVIWKGGNNGSTNISSVAHAVLPLKASGRVQMRQYVLSAFIEGATNNSFGGGGASNVILPELLREQVRAGIQSW